MTEQAVAEQVRNHFLGEIETEIVGMQHHKARIHPGEQVSLERESKNAHDRRAIRVENGQLAAGGLSSPGTLSSWLAPLIDEGKIHLDGYVPQSCGEPSEEPAQARPLILMVFQHEKGRAYPRKGRSPERA